MTALESQELKGVTTKLILWIIGGTISICFSCFGVYFGITTKLDEALRMNTEQDKQIMNIYEDNRTRDLQIRAMQIQLNTIEFKVNEISEKQKQNFK